MKKFFILIAFCAQAIAGLAQTKYPGDKGWQPGPPAFGAEIEKDVRIPMEDGVVLDAKVAYPTSLATGKRAEETFPVLMMGYAPRAEASMGGNEGSEKHFADFDKAFWAGGDPAYDGTFWQDRIPLRWSRDIVENGIPVLQWGGWQDLNETGAVRGYVAFQNAVSPSTSLCSEVKRCRHAINSSSATGDTAWEWASAFTSNGSIRGSKAKIQALPTPPHPCIYTKRAVNAGLILPPIPR